MASNHPKQPSQADPASASKPAVENTPPEALIRRAILVLVPLLFVGGYLLRSQTPPGEANATDSKSPEAASASTTLPTAAPRATGAPPPSVPAKPTRRLGSEVSESTTEVELVQARRASSEPGQPEVRTELPAGIPAVELPNAHGTDAPSAPATSEPVSPCGGLFVRLITHADDEKFAFASIAKGFSEPAQLVHVGDSVGGFRVTGIEWDRVWVQSAAQRCAVGMHFGARDAEQQAAEGMTAEQYARLPWVLPHSIVRGLDKRSEMEFEVDEATIAALYERGADVFSGLRVKLIEGVDAETEGNRALQLHDIRIDSFLERLGLEQGDVLLAIDEEPVSSIEAVQDALKRARDADQLNAEFRRDGEAFRLSLSARRAR